LELPVEPSMKPIPRLPRLALHLVGWDAEFRARTGSWRFRCRDLVVEGDAYDLAELDDRTGVELAQLLHQLAAHGVRGAVGLEVIEAAVGDRS
ncbi:MAG: hypothetical protein ABMA64_41300, partial [Myxococcota bacterium]